MNCVRQEKVFSDVVINQAIRKSLKGQAKRVLLPMGVTAKTSEILTRLEGVFGNVATGESILQEFYTAIQQEYESVTMWGLRLEELLQKALEKEKTEPLGMQTLLKYLFAEGEKHSRGKCFSGHIAGWLECWRQCSWGVIVPPAPLQLPVLPNPKILKI